MSHDCVTMTVTCVTCDITSYFYPSLKKEIKEKEKRNKIKSSSFIYNSDTILLYISFLPTGYGLQLY